MENCHSLKDMYLYVDYVPDYKSYHKSTLHVSIHLQHQAAIAYMKAWPPMPEGQFSDKRTAWSTR